MAYTNATTSANVSISAMSSEAEGLYQQAKKYKAVMDALKADDPQRTVYDQIIRDLLERAGRLATTVSSTAAK